MLPIVSAIALAVYVAATTVLAVYAVHSLWLLVRFLRRRRAAALEASAEQSRPLPAVLPTVLVQLPVYNERDVVERLVEAAGRLRWPRDRLRIQLLDDSTDDAVTLGSAAIRVLRSQGVDATVLRRTDRVGFKAGALAAGLETDAKNPGGAAEFVAIFDADFVPNPDFLEVAIRPFLSDARLGLVQGRWEHLNRDANRLTRAQAIGIDAHFALEQGARAWSGLPMNFNGTCGMWRVAAIHDSGGWQHDTLTEDMDLSYRSQLRGWKCAYRIDLAVPGEIPATASAWRAQQFRWAKGSIQTAKKLLPKVWRSEWSLAQKLAATFHTTHYLVHLLIVASLIAAPIAIPTMHGLPAAAVALGAGLFVVGIGAPLVLYTCAQFVLRGGKAWRRLLDLPIIAAIGTGVAISNSRAVWQALRGRVSEFVRTPKQGDRSASSYLPPLDSGWIELVSCVWASLGVAVGATGARPWMGLVLVLYASGFAWMGLLLRRERARGGDGVPNALAWLVPLGALMTIGYGVLGAAPGTWRDRPIFFAAIGCALGGLYLASCIVVRRVPLGRWGLGWIAGVAILIRLAALGVAPSDDLNRYIVEGTQVRFGENPYLVSPAQTAVGAELPSGVLSGVNHPDWTAIYPPVTLFVEAAVTSVTVAPLGFKVVMLFAELLGLWLIYRLLAYNGQPRALVLLAAWSPLGPLFGVGEGHHDFLMASLIAAALYLWVTDRARSGLVAAALSALIKPFAVIALLARLGLRDARGWLLAVVVAALAYAPFAGAGELLFQSLGRFGAEMHFHGVLEPVVRACVGAVTDQAALLRPLTLAVLSVVWLAASAWVLFAARRDGGATTAARLFGVLLVCLPTLHPWYLAPAALLLPFTRSWAWIVWIAMSPSYWLHALGMSDSVSWVELGWVTALAHVPATVILFVELILVRVRETAQHAVAGAEVAAPQVHLGGAP